MQNCAKCKKETETLSDDSLCPTCDDVIESSQAPKPSPCPCAKGPTLKKALMMCTDCEVWWHPACVGLAGLSHYSASSIVAWECPRCFTLDREITENLGIPDKGGSEGDADIRATVRAEMKTIIPEVVAEVKAGVRIALGEESMQKLVSGAKDAITKSWADVAKTEQKRVIKEVVEQTSESALTKGLGRISADLSEQKNRGRNCIVSNIPEGHGTDRATLTEVVTSFGVVEASDIADAKRLGEEKRGTNRLVLVIFKREDVAADFHNYGRGRNIEGEVWVNPDLTRTEREARYQERQDRRRKKQRQPQQPVRNATGVAPEDITHQPPPVRTDTNGATEDIPLQRRQSTRGQVPTGGALNQT